jgi:hypothetical protein
MIRQNLFAAPVQARRQRTAAQPRCAGSAQPTYFPTYDGSSWMVHCYVVGLKSRDFQVLANRLEADLRKFSVGFRCGTGRYRNLLPKFGRDFDKQGGVIDFDFNQIFVAFPSFPFPAISSGDMGVPLSYLRCAPTSSPPRRLDCYPYPVIPLITLSSRSTPASMCGTSSSHSVPGRPARFSLSALTRRRSMSDAENTHPATQSLEWWS